MVAMVSTVAVASGPFPAVDRVLGARNREKDVWSGALPDIAGRYGAFHIQDYYGFGKQSRIDY